MINDKDWLQAILDSLKTSDLKVDGIALPSFPDADVSDLTITNGRSEAMLKGAFALYSHVKRASATHGRPLEANSQVLDFGCGWGRIARFFLREIPLENLYGVDVVPKLIEVCRDTFNSENFTAISQTGTLPFSDATFDIAFANSVFSHLDEALNLSWMREIHRVLQPGGLAMLTIIDPKKFVIMADGAKDWMDKIGVDVKQTQKDIEAAGFYWHTTQRKGELTGYGLAVITPDWIAKNWGEEFEVLETIEDYHQMILVLKKR